MAITVRKFNAQVKDPNTGNMIPAGLLSSDALGAIDDAKDDAIDAIVAQGTTTRESIPSDYTALSDEVNDLKNAVKDISDTGTNLANNANFLLASGWAVQDGNDYYGQNQNLCNAFASTNGGFPMPPLFVFKENTQYSISMEARNDSGSSTDITDFKPSFAYTDGTTSAGIYYSHKAGTWTARTAVSTAGKTVKAIWFQINAYVDTVWHIRNFSIIEGATSVGATSLIPYVPYYYSAVDNKIRNDLYSIIALTADDIEIGTIATYGTNDTSDIRARVKEPIYLPKNTVFSISMYDYWFYWFDDSYTYTGTTGAWLSDSFTAPTDGYYRIVARKRDSSTITSSDFAGIAAGLTIKAPASFINDRTKLDFVPGYMTSYPTAKANARQDIAAAGYDGFSFAFITDLHWPKNAKISPVMLKELSKDLNLGYIINGGDLIDANDSASGALDVLADCYTSYLDLCANQFFVIGNHDTNTVGQTSQSARHLNSKQVFGVCYRNLYNEKVEFGDADTLVRMPYYIDAPIFKTRIVVADTGLEGISLYDSQLNWLRSAMSSAPSDYRIILAAHIWCQSGSDSFGLQFATQGTQLMNLVDTFNASSTGAKVKLCIGGHVHKDANYTTAGGVPLILTTCDCMTYADGRGQKFTNNCSAFDVITINYATKTINCRRFGRGSDRTFTYT